MKRKQKILIWVCSILVVGGIASYFGAKEILRQRIEGWGKQGIAASNAGEHEKAAELLGRFLRRRPDRVDALSAFVKSRELAPLPNGQHLVETIVALKSLVALAPDRIEDRRHLLELYVKLNRRPEALDVANSILDPKGKYAKDPRTIELKTEVLMGLMRYREAVELAEEWSKIDPDNLKVHMARISGRAKLKQPADLIIADAEKLQKAHPGDPRYEFLLGFAHIKIDEESLAPNQAEPAFKWLKTAAAHPDLSDDLSKMIVAQLNVAGLSSDSLALLQTRVEKGGSPEVKYMLARRLWQMGQWDKVSALLADLDLKSDQTDPTLIAFKAVAAARLGKPVDAKPYRDALASRKVSAAQAWTLILNRALDNAQIDDKELIKNCKDALIVDSQNSYLAYYMGDSSARLGETDLAIQAWGRAAAENSTWPEPALRLVEALLRTGKPEEAIRVAEFARNRNPTNASAAISLARAYAAGLESGVITSERAQELLKFVTAIHDQLPNEESAMTLQVQVAAQKGVKDQAITLAKQAIAKSPAISERALLSLAGLSHRFGLGVESECFAACEKAHGLSPNMAYVQAVMKSIAENPDKGLALFEDLGKRSGKSQELGWRMARARYLDIVANPAAKNEWIALGTSFPGELAVQEAAANARSVRGEWTFLLDTIERLHKLTGEDGLAWRLTKARILTDAPRNSTDSEDASVLLNKIIQQYPRLSEPHVLLAQALWRLQRYDGAIEHLTVASKLEPTSIPIALKLTALLQSRGDYDRVRQELDRMTPKLHTPEQRRQAAILMAEHGDYDRAIKIMEELKKETGKEDLLLVTLYQTKGEFNKVDEMLAKLLEKPNIDIITFASSFYVSQARNADAEKALKAIDTLSIAPEFKDLAWANYYIQVRNIEEALKHFLAVTQLVPANVTAWEFAANCQISMGQTDLALQTIEQGSRAVPSDKGLALLKEQFGLLRQCMEEPDLQPLVGAVIRNPLGSDLMLKLLATIADARRTNNNQRLAVILQQFAEQNPTFLQAHVQLARCYWRMGRTRDALSAAQRAMAAFPTNPDPAQFATDLYESAGSWQEMLNSAEVWKKRSQSGPMGPDLSIAGAQIGLKHYDAALKQLEPYVSTATAQPDRYSDVLIGYCISLGNTNQVQKAIDIIWPLAQKNVAWRMRWIQAGLSLQDPPTALYWVERGASLIPADAAAERVSLARCYDYLGRRDKDTKLVQRATDLYKQICSDPKVDAGALIAAATHAEQNQDTVAAEDYYRRALAKNPNIWVAQNNLAMIIANRGGNIKEAIDFAAAAVKSQPHSATLYDTLAQMQAKSGDFKAAVQTVKTAISLEPDNSKWRVRLAQYLLDTGDTIEAGKTIVAIDSAGLDVKSLPPNVRQQLDTIRKQVKLDK